MAHISLDPGAGAQLATAGRSAVEDHARRHAHGLARLARAGYVAKGIIFLVIGGLALMAATGSGGGTTDSRGALHVIGASSLGRALLAAMGAGLLGFALWSVIAQALDAEDRGHEPKGLALRIGKTVTGIAYGALGVEALRTVVRAGSSGGDGARHWTARVMALPWGRWLVVAIGAGVIGYALYQVWKGARKDLRRRLHLMGEDTAHRWVLRVARFGIVARAVVFLVIGWFLVQAGLHRAPGEVGGIDAALGALAAQSYGPWLLGVVAVGLMAYGVWELVNARYRDLPVS
jgi:hypothetical protein